MPRSYTTTELKLISNEEIIELDDEGNEIQSYEVEAVLNHRGPPKNREYLVRWKNHSSEWDEWLTADKFNDPFFVLKTNPSGTISIMMKSVSLDDDISNLADVAAHSTNPNSKRSYPHSISYQSKKARRDKQYRHSISNAPVAATRTSKRLRNSSS
ncbi:hypothetical protein G6F43_012615 [Rhizopus delemar]|nr:hypothetical protein G6F43_012615 [Rhizopus delemar]